MQRTIFLFAAAAILFGLTVSPVYSQPTENSMTPYAKGKELYDKGLFKDAVDLLRPWILDPKSAEVADKEAVPEGIAMVVQALQRLNRTAELDGFLVEGADVHRENWRNVTKIADTYFRSIPHDGYIIDDEFERGGHRGGGKWADAREGDLVLAMRLYAEAMPLAQKDDDKKAVAQFFDQFAELFVNHAEAWKMQTSTDWTTLPDYETERHWRGHEASRAPVDAKGNPIFYSVPKSFKEAKNDGERWRWCLEQVVEYDPSRAADVFIRRASFSESQFGERTLQSFDFFRDQFSRHSASRQASIWSLETLPDTETIANLATGIKRFELPEEFNYIALYKKALEKGDRSALNNLAEITLNRRQYPKAADYLNAILSTTNDQDAKDKLNQIIKNWGRFDSTQSKVAGTDATLRYVFRNGKKVNLTATEIDIEKLLGDVKNYLKSKPANLDWQRMQIDQIGYQLIYNDKRNDLRQQYLGKEIVSWSVDLEPAEKHFDGSTIISVPIKKAGAYLVKAEMVDGNTEYIVLWLNDTAIVQKQLDGANLYFVADAATGKPVPSQNVDFFGYKNEWKHFPNPGKGQQRKPAVFEWSFGEFSSPTDADGLAMLTQKEKIDSFNWLITVKNNDGRFAFLGFNNIWFGNRYEEEYEQLKTFFISDRPVYRPKDKVEFKVWIGTAKYDQPNVCALANQEIDYEIYDPRGEKIVDKKSVKLDAYGGFVDSMELPKDAALGMYQVNVVHHGGGTFRVEEYRKPEYEVSVDAPKEPVKLGDKIKATIRAKYYFGSPVTEATVKYKVLREKADADWYPIRPWDWFYGSGYWWFAYDADWLPGWSKWGCKRPFPFWYSQHGGPPEVVAEQEVKIGPDGTVDVEIDTSFAKEIFPNDSQRYKITAEVVDQSRRTIDGSGSVLVSKEPFKVYAWVNRGYYEPGQQIEASFQARRLDGKPVGGKAVAKLYRITYAQEPGGAVPGGVASKVSEIFSQEINLNDEGNANLSLTAAEAGQYRISCMLNEQEGGYVFNVYSKVASPDNGSPGWEFNDIELIPDKAEFAPGETVALRVNAKRQDATVLLFLKPTNGISTKPQVLRMEGVTKLIDVPVELRDMPNFFIEAITVADGQVYSETKEFAVPPEQRILNVEVKPSSENYKPGAKAKAEIYVTDLAGTPRTGQIVVSIYDKSVEYISGGSNVGDIKEFFWKWRRHHHPQSQSNLEKHFGNMTEPGQPGMQQLGIFSGEAIHALDSVTLGEIDGESGKRMLRKAAAPMAAGAMADAAMPPGNGGVAFAAIDMASEAAPMEKQENRAEMESAPGSSDVEPTVRKNFADTALWVGALETNKDGVAQIELDMPESLTTWKINVWSMGMGTRVGYGNAEVVTRKDLIIRMQTPRFLVEKDKVVFSANVHNYLQTEKRVAVSLETQGGLKIRPMEAEVATLPGEPPQMLLDRLPTQHVTIPAGGEKRVDWFVQAQAAGDAVVRMKAITDEESDAMEKTLPVYVHGMLKTDSFSAYVAPDKNTGTITVNVPEARRPEETKLTVRFAPSLAVSMVDALPYLVDYPYGCTEQTLNRFLPTVIVQKVIQETGVRRQESGEKWAIARKRAGVCDPDLIADMVRDGVQKLTNMQCSDGGWGWFSGYGEHSSPHLTALVFHGLKLAQQNDVAVPDGVLQRAEEWLNLYQKEQVEWLKNAALSDDEKKNKRWKSQADETDAFVMMVLHEDDRGKKGEMVWWTGEMRDFLRRDRAKLSLYAVAMLGTFETTQLGNPNEAKKCVQLLEQYLVQDDENQTAYLNLGGSSNWCWWAWHGSEFETQAYYLKLLNRTDPKGKIAPKLVKYLLNNRKHATYWNSTRDTAICVEAFAEFLKASGEEKPNMVVDVLADGVVKKTVEFTPENLLDADGQLVLEKDAVPTGARKIELRKKGTGALYVNAYLEYFSLEDPIPKSGLEVKVERRIYRLERDESAKTQAAGGHGQVVDMKVEKYTRTPIDSFKSGDLVEIELVVESKNDYESIILEDFKAAGLEPVEVRSGYNGNELGAYVEFRDERVAFFVYRLMRGKHSVSYRLRAETPGTFSALPAKIEAMYAPELKGNSNENKVSVSEQPDR